MRHECRLRIGPARFRIGSDWRAPVELLKQLYRGYPASESEVPDFTVRLEAQRPWRRFIRPSIAISGDFTLPDAAPVALAHGLLTAEMGMNLQMALGWRRHLLIHAGAVERGGRALILTGASGAGKSTLSAMLGERGWRFLGDEFVLLDPETGLVWPFPRLISLKNQAIDAMERSAVDDRFGPRLVATPKGDIRHLRPPEEAVAEMDRSAKPALLLFPRFGQDTAVREMGALEVFVRLTQASTNYIALGEAGFRTLTNFVCRVPARAVDYGTGEAGVDVVERLWTELAAEDL